MKIIKIDCDQQRITQHKRFAEAHPNFFFLKTSFILKSLYAIGHLERKVLAKSNIKERKKHD